MSPNTLRFVLFFAGLVGLRGLETRIEHHRPLSPLLPRWQANLSLGLVSAVITYATCAACLLWPWPANLPLAALHLPGPIRFVIEILLLDLVTYLLHRAYHRVPLLWRLHVVHHTDPDLDVSSASRFHPGEVVLSSVVKIGLVAMFGIGGAALVTFEILMQACAQFQHSNVRLAPRAEDWLWRTIVPPEMHRLHHTPNPADTDSNYGTILTIWDRWLGTLNSRRRAANERIGIETPQASHPLRRLLVMPLRTETLLIEEPE